MTNLSIKIYGFVTGLFRREEGQDLIEYALIGGLAAVALIGLYAVFNADVSSMINNIGDCIDFESTTSCDIDIP
jgi:Flp pilus assembly pilin Flp